MNTVLSGLIVGTIKKVVTSRYTSLILTNQYLYSCGDTIDGSVAANTVSLVAKNVLDIFATSTVSAYITPYIIYSYDGSNKSNYT